MQTVTSTAGGDVDIELPVFPGNRYSLYLRRGASSPPTTGLVQLQHTDDDDDYNIYNDAGALVYWDASSESGQTFEFVAQTRRLTLIGNTLGVSKTIDYSLIKLN